MLAFEHLELDASALGSLRTGKRQDATTKTLPNFVSVPLTKCVPSCFIETGAVTVPSSTTDLCCTFWPAHASTSRLELGLKDPVIARQAGADLSTAGFSSPSSAAAADPGLGARDALLRAEAGAPVDLAANSGRSCRSGAAAPSRETRDRPRRRSCSPAASWDQCSCL